MAVNVYWAQSIFFVCVRVCDMNTDKLPANNLPPMLIEATLIKLSGSRRKDRKVEEGHGRTFLIS